MAETPPAIATVGLGKRFRLYPSNRARLLEWLSLGRWVGHRGVWALREIDLTVAPGDAIALLGENGAGKSTLLSLLLGTTQPSAGGFQLNGTISGLLELGLGLQGELTGRQNALLALELRGISRRRAEAEGLVDAIAGFAELGEAFERPLRTYSTGMQMRLGFAAATVVRPDILIIDEALAVGDVPFQFKCMDRIRAFQQDGTTLLFVSHDFAAMRALCRRGVLLEAGRLLADGPIDAVLDRYNALLADKRGFTAPAPMADADPGAGEVRDGPAIDQSPAELAGLTRTRAGDGQARFTALELTDAADQPCRLFRPGQAARLQVTVAVRAALADLSLGVLLRTPHGLDVFGTNTGQRGQALGPVAAGETVRLRFDFPMALGPGRYGLTLAAHAGSNHLAGSYDWIDNALSFEVLPDPAAPQMGAVILPLTVTRL